MVLKVLLRRSSFPAFRPDRLLLTILTLTTLAACARAVSTPSGASSGAAEELLGEELRPIDDALLGPVEYDLPVEANSWVEAELEYLITDRRDVVRSWITRGDFYAEFVKAIFREQGMPTDLYHLGMIESGFVPVARSPVGAVGMWQFMPATGREVGLRVDSNVDERMDPVRSTRAAARHLRSLYRIHGDWTLAAAAYNAGSGRINRGLERFGARDFWELAQKGDLAAETRRYVPRLFAMTIIGRDRERFGFERAGNSAGFAFDSVHVDYSIPLDELGEMAGVDPLSLATMNPHLTEGMTPAGGYWVWVPAGTGPEVQRAYLASTIRAERGLGSATADRSFEVPEEERPTVAVVVPSPEPVEEPAPPDPEPIRPALATVASTSGTDARFHVVSAGETLSAIARRYETTVGALQETNELSGSVIVPGQRLALPSSEPASSTVTTAPAEPAFSEHTVEAGETLTGIGRRYGASVSAIQAANELTGSVIVPGQRLRVPVSGDAMEAALPAAVPAYTEHTVQSGETLSSIARRYGTSVSAVQESNEITGSVIRPGQRLRIPSAAAERKDAADSGDGVASVEHVVESGDSLWGIARRYGSSVEAIIEANALGDRPIVPGQRLTVPRITPR